MSSVRNVGVNGDGTQTQSMSDADKSAQMKAQTANNIEKMIMKPVIARATKRNAEALSKMKESLKGDDK